MPKRAVYVVSSASVRSSADFAVHRNEQCNFFMAIFLLRTLRLSAFAFVNSVFGRCGKVPLDRSCWVLRLFAPVSLCVRRWIPIKIVFFTDFFVYSSEFCEAHLQLLFTILEKAPQATIRANTIVAVGDLTFRFPNLIEPWTSHLYARFVNGELQTYKVLESVQGVSEESHRSLLLVKWTIHFPPSLPALSPCSYNKLVAAQILISSRT